MPELSDCKANARASPWRVTMRLSISSLHFSAFSWHRRLKCETKLEQPPHHRHVPRRNRHAMQKSRSQPKIGLSPCHRPIALSALSPLIISDVYWLQNRHLMRAGKDDWPATFCIVAIGQRHPGIAMAATSNHRPISGDSLIEPPTRGFAIYR